MTREEAIGRIKDHMIAHHMGEYPHIRIKEALDLALAALRGPTREMLEKMFPGCPGCDSVTSKWEIKFCPFCGKPRTDEAVDILWQRWKEAVDGENL